MMKVFKKFISDIRKNSFHVLDYVLAEDIESTLSIGGIRARKICAPLLQKIYRFQSEYQFVCDGREPLMKRSVGKIFIVNHRQSDDVVFSANTIKCSGYFVFGNQTLLLDSFTNGIGLWLYGVISLNRKSKTNRKACLKKMKWVLEHGGNIIICPEGYWNLADDGQKDERHGADDHNSESWIIQDFNIGAIKLAQEVGAGIIPVVLHYDELKKNCYGRRCKEIIIDSTDDIYEKKDFILAYMRSIYWEMMEKYSYYERGVLECNGKNLRQQWEELKEKLIRACDISSVSYKLNLQDEKKIGKAKVLNVVTTNEEAFEHLTKLHIRKENSFLFSKHNIGIKNNERFIFDYNG